MTSMLIRRSDVLAAGFTDNDIRRARRLGELTAICPGVYLPEADARQWDTWTRHRAAVDAVLPRLSGAPVVSHLSAAILHRLTSGDVEPVAVHVIRAGSAKSRRGAAVQSHRATLTAAEVRVLDGLAITSVARTLLDCALLLPFEPALELAETGLRRGLVTRAELTVQRGRYARVAGSRLAAAVIEEAIG